MKILVILGHPDKESFNHAIAQTTAQTLQTSGHEVIFHDLYDEGFDPILTNAELPKDAKLDPVIEKHCHELTESGGIVIIHPNWWGAPPAIIKGWIDRVIRPGAAYAFVGDDGGEGVPVGLLKAKAALVFNTSNTAIEREMLVFGDPLETIWKNCIFGLCGVNWFYRKSFTTVVTSDEEKRFQWLDEVKQTVEKYFPQC